MTNSSDTLGSTTTNMFVAQSDATSCQQILKDTFCMPLKWELKFTKKNIASSMRDAGSDPANHPRNHFHCAVPEAQQLE